MQFNMLDFVFKGNIQKSSQQNAATGFNPTKIPPKPSAVYKQLPPSSVPKPPPQNPPSSLATDFFNKLQQLGHVIQQPNDEPQHLTGNETSGKVSLVMSLNEATEEGQPMILSNILNKHTTIDKIALLRIRNALSEVRQVQFDLVEYLEDQRIREEEFRENVCANLEDFFSMASNKTGSSTGLTEILEMREENTMIKQKLQKKQGEYSRACKEVVELKTTLELERSKTVQKGGSREDVLKTSTCLNCKSLERKLVSLSQEIGQHQHERQKTQIENERLQEYIFDIEQKIVGIDLQVQKGIKEKLKLLPQHYNQNITQSNQGEVDQLKEEIYFLQQTCRKYEQKQALVDELENQFTKISEEQHDLQNREIILRKEENKLEELKQVSYQREHQLLQAQQNLSKKINDLRLKQSELTKYQSQLVRKATESRLPISQPQTENNYGIQSQEQLNHSRQMSLRSFGKAPPEHPVLQEVEFKIPPRTRTYTHQQIQTFNPKQQLQKIYDNYHDPTAMRKVETRKYIDNGYQKGNANNSGKGKLSSSYYKDSRQPSPYRAINQRRGHIHIADQSPTNNYRQASKHSRSSAVHSIRGSLGISSLAVRQKGEPQQLTGLSSKLERLREEIKKEIQSIK